MTPYEKLCAKANKSLEEKMLIVAICLFCAYIKDDSQEWYERLENLAGEQ